jgi:hypothetical protein
MLFTASLSYYVSGSEYEASVANKHLTDMHDASVQSGRKAATPPKVAQGGGKRSAAAPYRGVGRQAPQARSVPTDVLSGCGHWHDCAAKQF